MVFTVWNAQGNNGIVEGNQKVRFLRSPRLLGVRSCTHFVFSRIAFRAVNSTSDSLGELSSPRLFSKKRAAEENIKPQTSSLRSAAPQWMPKSGPKCLQTCRACLGNPPLTSQSTKIPLWAPAKWGNRRRTASQKRRAPQLTAGSHFLC